MLLTLALWILLLIASSVTGAAVLRLFGNANEPAAPGDRFAASVWTGLLTLSSLLLWTSLAAPLKHFGWVVLFAAPALLLVPGVRQAWRESLPGGAAARLSAAVLIVCCAATSGVVMLHDTGLYHYGMLRWLGETGTVPGLGGIAYRFGFSSTWFATAATVDSGPWWSGRATAVANGCAFALVLYQLLVSVSRVRTATAGRSDAFVLAAYPLVLAVSLLQRWQVSASPNLVVAAGLAVLGWLLIATRSAAPVLLAGALAAVKLTAAPALVVVLAARRRQTNAFTAAAIAAVLALPAMVASHRTVDCPLFPSPLLCAEQGVTLARVVTVETRDWARYLGRLPDGTTWWSMDWLPGWFASPLNSVFFAAAVGGALVVLRRRAWSAAAVLGAAGFVWVMATAPDYRLGFGYAAVLVGCAAAALADDSGARLGSAQTSRLPLTKLAFGLVLLDAAAHEAAYYFLLHRDEARPRVERLLAPPEIRRPKIQRNHINGIEFVHPYAEPGELCWGAPIPCLIVAPDPKLRYCDPGQGIRGGFCR